MVPDKYIRSACLQPRFLLHQVLPVYSRMVLMYRTEVLKLLLALKLFTEDFSWDIDINWSKNTSKVLEIAEGFDVFIWK